ncbi:MAG: hypothetical protein MI867_10105, partial [Pseudomonadales bacterium]|nr:hypothetical protein [Pseudomonadales bacterium]
DGTIPPAAFVDKTGAGEKFRFRDRAQEIPSAAGIVQMTIVKSASNGIVKVKIRATEVDLDEIDGDLSVSLSMLFGSDPALDECLTARSVPCEPRPGKNKCSDR